MRLDLFLKASRLCSRRTVAQKVCEAGRVLLNGSPAKSSHAVKTGDEILLTSRSKIIRVHILSVPGSRQTSRKEAVSEESLDEEELRSQ